MRSAARALLTATVAVVLVTGCAAESNDATAGSIDAGSSDVGSGYVAGDGSILIVPESDRQAAPDLTGTTLDGATVSLADYLGDVVVVNVWASWCAPCRAEAPALAALSRELEPAGVQFIGLDTRDSDVSARAFVDRFGIDYPNVIDRDGQLQLLFSDSLPPQAIPSTLVIDRQGRVAGRILGKASESSLRGLVDVIAAEDSAVEGESP